MLRRRVALGLLLSVMASVFGLAPARAADSEYTTGFTRWRAGDTPDNDFSAWTRDNVELGTAGRLEFDPTGAVSGTDTPGGFNGGNRYNGGSYLVDEVISPEVTTRGFTEAIASWNADTPNGTWIETLISANIGERWTKWYSLGVWASGTGTVQRHYVNVQGDADGYVAVDTLVLNDKKVPATGFQLMVRLFRADGSSAVPTVRAMSVATSTTATKPSTLENGNPELWNTLLNVPECSQMVYPDGGEVWCSPTSTSMVLGFWQGGADTAQACEGRVRASVEGVYDWLYDGHGNWPFNTAYAATQDLEAYVARFTSMAQAEKWIAAGVPVVISFAWKKSSLEGAAIPSSNGHLAVLVGFDKAGNPIVNDPAATSDAAVQRTYDRAEFESLWLEHSGGTVYLIYPKGHLVPAVVP